MALINCPECGKEISDKANACPNCGCPINETNQPSSTPVVDDDEEHLYCPYCLSKQVHHEHRGFSGGKALAGAVTAGGIGMLAGTIGNNKVELTCMRCGKKFKAGEAFFITSKKKKRIEKAILESLKKKEKFEQVCYLSDKLWEIITDGLVDNKASEEWAKMTFNLLEWYMKAHPELKTKEMVKSEKKEKMVADLVALFFATIALFFILYKCS